MLDTLYMLTCMHKNGAISVSIINYSKSLRSENHTPRLHLFNRSIRSYSTAQRHCPLTRRPEPARALIANI